MAGEPCAPSDAPAAYRNILASGDLKAPIRSGAAARRTGEWDAPAKVRGAEDEPRCGFADFIRSKVNPAARLQREATRNYGRGKV